MYEEVAVKFCVYDASPGGQQVWLPGAPAGFDQNRNQQAVDIRFSVLRPHCTCSRRKSPSCWTTEEERKSEAGGGKRCACARCSGRLWPQASTSHKLHCSHRGPYAPQGDLRAAGGSLSTRFRLLREDYPCCLEAVPSFASAKSGAEPSRLLPSAFHLYVSCVQFPTHDTELLRFELEAGACDQPVAL